uniref:Ovule protein n=1 Tax=Angiostrongylus cantonensis TaxID=6313 RepID=A0A0K0D4P3_ANGCA
MQIKRFPSRSDLKNNLQLEEIPTYQHELEVHQFYYLLKRKKALCCFPVPISCSLYRLIGLVQRNSRHTFELPMT